VQSEVSTGKKKVRELERKFVEDVPQPSADDFPSERAKETRSANRRTYVIPFADVPVPIRAHPTSPNGSGNCIGHGGDRRRRASASRRRGESRRNS